MKIWDSKRHLTELALELRAANEAAEQERTAIDAHLDSCPVCKRREAQWRGLFLALASLRSVSPSPEFDRLVMERVRTPVRAKAPAKTPSLLRRLRPVAAAAAVVWTGSVVGVAAWAQAQLDVSLSTLLAGLLSGAGDLLVAAAIKAGALLQLSGLTAAWTRASEAVPGPSVAGALALMTLLSGLAIWLLYRVTVYQPPEMNAHV